MLILDATTKTIEVDLAGAVTTTELPIVAVFVDVTTTTYTPGSSDAITTGATAVTAVAAPGAATQRQVKLLTIYNADAVAAVVTVQLNNNTTIRPIVIITLAVGSTLVYTDGEGWRVINAAGEVLSSGSGGGGTPGGADTQVQFNDGGAFGGDAGFTYNKTTDALTLAGLLNLSGAAAGQIQFPSTQNASSNANTLDDYEEGTFTPALGGSGGQSGQVYTTQIGRYVKIGKSVFGGAFINPSTVGTITGTVRITGLPFAAVDVAGYDPPYPVRFSGLATNWVDMVGTIARNTMICAIQGASAAGVANNTGLVQGDLANGCSLFVSFFYETTA